MTNQPRLTVKNYKHLEALSEETDCFTATLYLDGKRIGTAQNHGHGGETTYDFPSPAARDAFNAYAQEWVNSDEVQSDPTHQINGKCYASEESLVALACATYRREQKMKRSLKNRSGDDYTTAILIERPVNAWAVDELTIATHPHHDVDETIAEHSEPGDTVYTYTAEHGVTKHSTTN